MRKTDLTRRLFLGGAVTAICLGLIDPSSALTGTKRVILSSKYFYDFFINSINGNDSYSGTRPTAAFKTLAKAQAVVNGQSDKRIGLITDSSWKEQFIFSNAPQIYIGSYGTGAQPFIDGSDQIPNGSFTLDLVTTYKATVTMIGATGTEQRLIWENGKNLVQVADEATVITTPGSFAYASYSAATTTVFVHASDSSDITTNGKIYEFNSRYNCISVTGNSATIQGIRTRRQRDNNGSIELFGDYCWVINCTIEDGHKHSAYMREGGGFIGTTFKNAYNGISGFPNYAVFNKDVGASFGMSVRNCLFTTDPTVVPSTAGIPTQFPTSVISHVNISGNLGIFNAFQNAHTLTGGYGIQNGGAENIVNDNFVNCTTIGSTSDAAVITIIGGSFIVNLLVNATIGFFSGNPASGRVSVLYSGMTFNTFSYNIRLSGNNLDSDFENCPITSTAAASTAGLIRITGTGGTLTCNGNNLLTGALNQAFYNLAADTVYVGNNNLFRIPSGTYRWDRSDVVVAIGLPAWQVLSGQDANSIAA